MLKSQGLNDEDRSKYCPKIQNSCLICSTQKTIFRLKICHWTSWTGAWPATRRVLLTRAPARGQQLANDFRQPGLIPFMASESFPFFFGRLR